MTLRGLPRPDAREIFRNRDLAWSPCKNLSLFDVHPLTDFPFQWNEGAKDFRERARERAPSFSLATPLHGDPLDETKLSGSGARLAVWNHPVRIEVASVQQEPESPAYRGPVRRV